MTQSPDIFFWKLSISLIAIIFCVHLVSDLRKGVSGYKYLSMKVKGNIKHFSADLQKYNWHRSLQGIPIYSSRVGLKDKEKKDKEENQIFNLETVSCILMWQVFILHIQFSVINSINKSVNWLNSERIVSLTQLIDFCVLHVNTETPQLSAQLV